MSETTVGTISPNLTDIRFVQSLKVSLPIFVTFLKTTETRLVQFWKVSAPLIVVANGIFTVVSLEQP
jgi:hypothetical protein